MCVYFSLNNFTLKYIFYLNPSSLKDWVFLGIKYVCIIIYTIVEIMLRPNCNHYETTTNGMYSFAFNDYFKSREQKH